MYYTDRNLNNYFSGVKKPQLILSNVKSNNASFKNVLVENKLQTNGNVTFNSSLSVNNNITTVVGDITSADSIHATTNLTSGVVTVPLYNTGGGADPYNSANTAADVFVDSTQGNIFSITAPSGSSLVNIYLYFNTSPEIPENIPTVNGTIITVLFENLRNQIVTVHLNSGSIVKVTAETLVLPANGYRSNIVFAGYSTIITEVCRSGSMITSPP